MIIFSFQHNLTEKVLKGIDVGEKFSVLSHEVYISKFVQQLLKSNPPFVLGLGIYSGRDNDTLRIETVCSNKFKNTVQGPVLYQRSITPFLQPLNKSKLAQGLGNSYCNLISFLIMDTIEKQKLQTKYTFIHVPKNFDIGTAINEINSMLTQSRYLL